MEDGVLRAAHGLDVREISSSRHWQRIWIATSFGMRFSSIRRRQKSSSICEALGSRPRFP